MKQALPLLTLGIAVATLYGASGPAIADTAAAPAAIGAPASESSAAHALFANAVSDDELSGRRGGADMHISDIRAVGSVSEVSASDLVTGHNIITDGALAGASGLPMFIQNSGNGVLIQNAVIVNLEMN